MKFYDLINNTNKDISLYVDMDGVIAEYDIGNFDYNTIRPLNSNINRIKELLNKKNITIYILSVCKTKNIVLEKIQWINKYMSFFNIDNCIFLCKEELDGSSKELKSNYLKNNCRNEELNIVIDDDIEIIKYIKSNNDVKIFHVSSWID